MLHDSPLPRAKRPAGHDDLRRGPIADHDEVLLAGDGAVVEARDVRARHRPGAVLVGRSPDPHEPVREREERLRRRLVDGVVPGSLDDPAVRRRRRGDGLLQLGLWGGGRQRAEVGLRVEQLHECGRTSAQVQDAARDAVRLASDRDDGRACGEAGHHPVVRALEAGDRSELITGQQHLAREDRAGGGQPPHDVGDRVGLVREADFDVLHVGGDARIAETGLRRGVGGHVDHRADASRDGLEALVDGAQKLPDPGLGRIRPLGRRDQVELAPVQPVSDDVDLDAVLGRQPVADGVGRAVERGVLLGRRLPRPEQRARAVGLVGVDLGPPVHHEVEPRKGGRGQQGRDLAADVVGVRPCDHDQEHAGVEQALHRPRQLRRVLPAIGHGGAVPVEGDQAIAVIAEWTVPVHATPT